MLQIKNTLGGGKPEGLYVWKKSSLNTVEKATSTNATTKLSDATNATITYYTSSSYTFDEATGLFALDNPTEATLPYGSSKSMSNNIYFIVGSPSGETMFKGTSSNTQLRNNSNGLLVEPYSSSYTYTVYTAEQEATFLDYVVSDKETAYPDGGEKDGYWYERVSDGIDLEKLGCTKFEEGSFTPSKDITAKYTINHSMGVIPKYFIVWTDGTKTTNTNYVKATAGYVSMANDSNYAYGHYMKMTLYGGSNTSTSVNSTSSTFVLPLPGSGGLVGGLTYNYLLFG